MFILWLKILHNWRMVNSFVTEVTLRVGVTSVGPTSFGQSTVHQQQDSLTNNIITDRCFYCWEWFKLTYRIARVTSTRISNCLMANCRWWTTVAWLNELRPTDVPNIKVLRRLFSAPTDTVKTCSAPTTFCVESLGSICLQTFDRISLFRAWTQQATKCSRWSYSGQRCSFQLQKQQQQQHWVRFLWC